MDTRISASLSPDKGATRKRLKFIAATQEYALDGRAFDLLTGLLETHPDLEDEFGDVARLCGEAIEQARTRTHSLKDSETMTDDSDADFRLDLSDLLGGMGSDTDYGVFPRTYVKVVVSGPSTFPRDTFVVLYPSPEREISLSGSSDFERTVMAGRWSVMDESVQLDGFGRVFGCCPDGLGPGRVQRTLKCGMNHSSPVLRKVRNGQGGAR